MTANNNTMDRCAWLRDSAAAWSFLHDLFRAPGEGQWRWLHENWVQEVWTRLSAWTNGNYTGTLPLPLPLPDDHETYEQQYLATFDVGLPTPPCPLIETHWNKREPTTQVLHEHILYYKCFGLELHPQAGETADHLRHQLEFLAYLCQLEARERTSPSRPGMADEIARGRLEFLTRHPNTWIPQAADELARNQPGSWTTAWLALLVGWSWRQTEIEAQVMADLAEAGGS